MQVLDLSSAIGRAGEPIDLSRPTIYGLVDPRDQRIRYVGQSINVVQRYRAHLKQRGTVHKVRWTQKLKAAGTPPLLGVIVQCDDPFDLRPLEVLCIAVIEPDLNVDDGTGVRNGTGPITSAATQEWRSKIAAAQTGKPSHFTGHQNRDASKQKMSEFMREHNRLHPRKLSPEHIEAMRLGRERAKAARLG